MGQAVKQRAVAIARSLRILPLLEAGRFLRDKWRTAEENRQFLAAHPGFAPPPLWWMHDMYRHTGYDLYWRTGQQTAEAIAAKIDAHVTAEAPRVADWGCGLGRVVRHLPSRYAKFGFDYNEPAINWCKEQVANVEFRVNKLSPPLPAEDGAFDALYALSVFTHLSAEGHLAWINEVRRVLAPGGVFLGAFHMRLPEGQLLPDEKARFDRGELVVRGGVKEGSRTFTAHHPESYLRDTLLSDFDILEPPTELFGQTLFVCRRRS